MKPRLVVIPAVLALALAPAAQAHTFSARTLQDVHVGKSKTELKAQMAYSTYVVEHFKQPSQHWKLLPRHSTCWTVPSRQLERTCNHARLRYFAHRWLLTVAKTRYTKLYAPKPAPASTPSAAGHWALWDCIHNGAYPGAAHEGTSSSGQYTGNLQMTNPWEGRSGNWYAMGTGVYAIAEEAFAANAYSVSWLYHQWPNTAPPCVAKLGM